MVRPTQVLVPPKQFTRVRNPCRIATPKNKYRTYTTAHTKPTATAGALNPATSAPAQTAASAPAESHNRKQPATSSSTAKPPCASSHHTTTPAQPVTPQSSLTHPCTKTSSPNYSLSMNSNGMKQSRTRAASTPSGDTAPTASNGGPTQPYQAACPRQA